MKTQWAVIGLALLCSTAAGQDVPAQSVEPPQVVVPQSQPAAEKKSFLKKFAGVLAGPFTDKKLLAAMLVQGGAMAFDGYTTSHTLRVCSGCREMNIFLGPRPSDRRIALTLGAGWYLQALLVKWEKDQALSFTKPYWDEKRGAFVTPGKKERIFWNTFWLTHPTVLTVGHTLAGLHNQRVAQCPSGFRRAGGVCTPF